MASKPGGGEAGVELELQRVIPGSGPAAGLRALDLTWEVSPWNASELFVLPYSVPFSSF